MVETRRCFLKNLATLSSSSLLLQSSPPIPGTRPRHPIDPPPPAEPEDQDHPVEKGLDVQRTRLQAQEKQFRETMSRLYSKVSELKAQVEALHPSQVFSIAIYKETQEIEKLAKQLKTYAKP